MNFFIVKESVNSKIIGNTFPQIQEVQCINRDQIIDLASTFGEPFEEELQIGTPIISKKAKLTDFLSSSIIMNTGLIGKTHLINSLSILSNESLRTFHLHLSYKNNLLTNYSYAHFSKVFPQCIDFERSKFRCFGSDQKVTFKDVYEMNQFIHNNTDFTSFYADQVILKLVKGIDIFKIHNNLKSTYCSQIFFDWYNANNLTGLEFVPLPETIHPY